MLAVITGASSGIGRDMARYLANEGWELILTARREQRLDELKRELPTKVTCISCDLSKSESCIEFYETVKGYKADLLINNAGFGIAGEFNDIPLDEELRLIQTNITAVHILTKLFLKDFVERDKGRILNVSSTAGFFAGPKLGSYYASKNYVLRLSEAIYEELRRNRSKVGISVFCPGPVNTEFNRVANVKFSVKGISSERAARTAIEGCLNGKLIIMPGLKMKLARFGERFISEKMMLKLSYLNQRRVR